MSNRNFILILMGAGAFLITGIYAQVMCWIGPHLEVNMRQECQLTL